MDEILIKSVEERAQAFLRRCRKANSLEHYVIIDSSKDSGKLIISYSPHLARILGINAQIYFQWFSPTQETGRQCPENENSPYYGLTEIAGTIIKSLKRKPVIVNLNKVDPKLAEWAYPEFELTLKESEELDELRERYPEYFYPGITKVKVFQI